MASATSTPPERLAEPAEPAGSSGRAGWLARLGVWSAGHLRAVLLAWLIVVVGFGAFAPRVESTLAGAGWQDSGSQSVAAQQIIQRNFSGLGSTAIQVAIVDHGRAIADDPAARHTITRATELLRADPRISTIVAPRAGVSLSGDGRTAVIQAGAAADPNEMVRAVDDLSEPLRGLSSGSVSVEVTGASALWSDFNAVNHSAMMRSEILSWPVTLGVLVLAFGSLAAAGLPLMLTLVGLISAAGALVIATHIAPVSVWALNFAMMFALALGIDYALFLVVRFRAALRRRAGEPARGAAAVAAIGETMDTAGKAVAFSGLTVLVSLSTVLLVPSPAFRSMALGIMLSVIAVLAATLTLLPAVLGRLGTRIDAGHLHLPGAGDRAQRRTERRAARTTTQHPAARHEPRLHPSTAGLERLLHHWGGLLHRRPWLAGGLVLVILGLLAWPVASLRTGMPSIAIIPPSQTARAGYTDVVAAFGPGAPGTLSILTPATQAEPAQRVLSHDRGITAVMPGTVTAHGWSLAQAVPTTDPSAPATGATIDRLRHDLPTGSLIGGAAAENHDLDKALSARTPLVFGLLVALGFLLLLVALGSPLVAFAGVITNLGSITAAFGVATWIFQDGHLSGLLHFEPQGFVDAWAPLFFGAMLTGVAMDYTLFLLSAAREHYDRTSNPLYAMRMALRTSGRVVVAAASVMIAVFLTFALSGPLAPKEMGVILAVAVFLDALCVRLILLPVALRLAGHTAWHQPRWLDRLLPHVHFSH